MHNAHSQKPVPLFMMQQYIVENTFVTIIKRTCPPIKFMSPFNSFAHGYCIVICTQQTRYGPGLVQTEELSSCFALLRGSVRDDTFKCFFKSLLFSAGQQMQGREAVASSLNERARANRVGTDATN